MSSRLRICQRILRLQEEIRDLGRSSPSTMQSQSHSTAPSGGSRAGASSSTKVASLMTGSAKSSSGSGRKPRPTYYTLNPEGFGAGAANVVDRCLMDNVQDEVFILQQIREHVPADVYLEVKRALDNISVRSRHVGTELIRVAKDIEKAAP